MSSSPPAKIAVIGAGWWSQGWHLPHLDANPNAKIVAIVDPCPHPQSILNPNLVALTALSERYHGVRVFSSVDELLLDDENHDIGSTVQGLIVCTPHATHSAIGQVIVEVNKRRIQAQQAPIHILMEKPFTTRMDHAWPCTKQCHTKYLRTRFGFLSITVPIIGHQPKRHAI